MVHGFCIFHVTWFYSYIDHSNPSFVSLMLKPRVVNSFLILSDRAKSFVSLASNRSSSNKSIAFGMLHVEYCLWSFVVILICLSTNNLNTDFSSATSFALKLAFPSATVLMAFEASKRCDNTIGVY